MYSTRGLGVTYVTGSAQPVVLGRGVAGVRVGPRSAFRGVGSRGGLSLHPDRVSESSNELCGGVSSNGRLARLVGLGNRDESASLAETDVGS